MMSDLVVPDNVVYVDWYPP